MKDNFGLDPKEDDYRSQGYRQYLIDHGHTLDQYMEKIDAVINS